MDITTRRPLLVDVQTTRSAGTEHVRSRNDSRRYSDSSRGLEPLLAKFGRGKLRSNRDQRAALLAALASVTAIVFCILICQIVSKDRTESLVAGRKLSGVQESSILGRSIVSCIDPEGESGGSTYGESEPFLLQQPASTAEKVDVNATAKLNKVEDEPKAKSTRFRREVIARRANSIRAIAHDLWHVEMERKQSSPGDTVEHFSRDFAELEAAQALLALHQPSGGSFDSLRIAAPYNARSLRSLLTWPEDSPAQKLTAILTAIPESSERPSATGLVPQLHEQQQPPKLPGPNMPYAGGASAEGDIPTRPASGERPGIILCEQQPIFSTALQLPPMQLENRDLKTMPAGQQPGTNRVVQTPSAGKPLSGHPFYRLPLVNPSDQAVTRFRPRLLRYHELAYRRFQPLMSGARTLLTKSSLSADELESLSILLQHLVSYAYHYENGSLKEKKMARVCYVLGRRFWLLDTVISALQVLGISPIFLRSSFYKDAGMPGEGMTEIIVYILERPWGNKVLYHM
ncbi:hypothetical protein Efla_007750 [Eimeria flavescens]